VPYCPECGGDMYYDNTTKKYICKSCGLSLTYQQLMEIRDELRSEVESEEEKLKRKRKEYLEWWFSRKK